MKRKFGGLLSVMCGGCVALVMVFGLLSATTTSADAVIAVKLGEHAELRAGGSVARVQVEVTGETARLHILVLAHPGDTELITSSIRLSDGQKFALAVPVDETSDRANRFVFERRGNTVVVQGLAWSSDRAIRAGRQSQEPRRI